MSNIFKHATKLMATCSGQAGKNWSKPSKGWDETERQLERPAKEYNGRAAERLNGKANIIVEDVQAIPCALR